MDWHKTEVEAVLGSSTSPRIRIGNPTASASRKLNTVFFAASPSITWRVSDTSRNHCGKPSRSENLYFAAKPAADCGLSRFAVINSIMERDEWIRCVRRSRNHDQAENSNVWKAVLMATRIFLLGIIILFFGVQLRSFDSFVLNEKVSRVINRQIEKRQPASPAETPLEAGFLSFDSQTPKALVLPTKRTITPPRWLGYSLLSMGAVLVLTCPLFRR